MDKNKFHKKVENMAQRIGSVKKAFDILNNEYKSFTSDVCYRNWKSKHNLKTIILSDCLICGVQIKSTKKRKWCVDHVGGRKNKKIPKKDGIHISERDLYSVWHGIKYRCTNKKSTSFKNYGGRGIKICDLWNNDFYEFEKWSLDNGYKKGLQIDRINNNGNYEPSNCRYVEPYINATNRRSLKNTSGFIGVHKNTESNTYRVLINFKNKRHDLGNFKNKVEAAIFRDQYIIKNNLPHMRNLL